MNQVRVLVVDDSATMRALIRRVLEREADITVVGDASNAQDARSAVKALNPDVITLDIEMPEMNGLDFLDRLMRLRPTPVVMVSSLTSRGAEATIRALEMGAIDCVAKPSSTSPHSLDRLAEAVRVAARAHPTSIGRRPSASSDDVHPSAAHLARSDVRLVAMAASTGGVEALIRVFSQLSPNAPPIAVVQHMPPLFTASFAQRLDRLSAVTVTEAVDGAPLGIGQAVVAPGGERHLEVVATPNGSLRCRLADGPLESGHCPSADRLFHSAARAVQARAIGVILTGMGRDGAAGLLAMRQAGAHTIGQDEATSVVFGMPNVAQRLGAVAEQLPLGCIAEGIARALRTSSSNRNRHHVIHQKS